MPSIWALSIAPVRLDNLFAEADQVVLVNILSGDAEHYDTAVYKAVVEDAYKGAQKGETIFFGPFIGYSIGSEYVLFLKNGAGEQPKNAGGLSYGPIGKVDRVMYDGYSSLPVSYKCVFDGREISQQCDYAVQLNPDQVVLPKEIRTFPAGDATAVTDFKKWVRRNGFLAHLRTLSNQSNK
jgi:hypothetical protein